MARKLLQPGDLVHRPHAPGRELSCVYLVLGRRDEDVLLLLTNEGKVTEWDDSLEVVLNRIAPAHDRS